MTCKVRGPPCRAVNTSTNDGQHRHVDSNFMVLQMEFALYCKLVFTYALGVLEVTDEGLRYSSTSEQRGRAGTTRIRVPSGSVSIGRRYR